MCNKGETVDRVTKFWNLFSAFEVLNFRICVMYRHWSERVRETVIRRTGDGLLNLKIRGGAELGSFPYFGNINDNEIIYESENTLNEGDLLLEVNNQTVAGLTLYDLNTIISRADDPVRLKSVREGLQIERDLRKGGRTLKMKPTFWNMISPWTKGVIWAWKLKRAQLTMTFKIWFAITYTYERFPVQLGRQERANKMASTILSWLGINLKSWNVKAF